VTPETDAWVGSSYSASELRIMVLGESWWGGVESLSSAIERWARDQQADATFSRIFNTCSGRRRERASYQDRMAFWNSIAFYNFVQGSLGATRKSRPSADHFRSAVPALVKILQALKPQCVWIVGLEQSKYSSPVLRKMNIPFEVVRHPSSGVRHEEFEGSWKSLLAKVS
jgi:hypothetical protein